VHKKIRHYVVKRKKAFWQPTRLMRANGFQSLPLGDHGPGAQRVAEQHNAEWDAYRKTAEFVASRKSDATLANLPADEAHPVFT
jgi:hypothetical protein